MVAFNWPVDELKVKFELLLTLWAPVGDWLKRILQEVSVLSAETVTWDEAAAIAEITPLPLIEIVVPSILTPPRVETDAVGNV